jgi:hypothetical protein
VPADPLEPKPEPHCDVASGSEVHINYATSCGSGYGFANVAFKCMNKILEHIYKKKTFYHRQNPDGKVGSIPVQQII